MYAGLTTMKPVFSYVQNVPLYSIKKPTPPVRENPVSATVCSKGGTQ